MRSAIAHAAVRLSVPVEVRPHVSAALAADPTSEALLDIGQSGIIGPGIAADRDGVATAVVGAIDQQAAHAHFAHFAEGDFGLAIGHAAHHVDGCLLALGSLPRFRGEGLANRKSPPRGRKCELVHSRVVGIELTFPKQEATALTLPIGILIVGSVYLALLYSPVILYLG